MREKKKLIFDIKRDCSEDGPGIRTTVFFKGCPLSCTWCHNPEGISPRAGLSYAAERCDPDQCGGYACLAVCPSNALMVDHENKKIQADHDACTRCDLCFNVCTTSALEPVGTWWGVQELAEKVLVDKHFFQSTGGGVTLSGGEPTLQMEYLRDFLPELKKEEVNIGMETSGMFDADKFGSDILPYLDFIYFDLKLFSPEESRRYTGCSNEQIQKNFLFLHYEAGIPVSVRIPLVPGITATKVNLTAMAQFLRKHGVDACSLMPYNPTWHDKAVRLGMGIHYAHNTFMSKLEEDRCFRYFTA